MKSFTALLRISSIILCISPVMVSSARTSDESSKATLRNKNRIHYSQSSSSLVRMDLNEPLSATSTLGQSILTRARRLENENNNDQTWVVGYSLKFLGCHAVSQYNANANDENENSVHIHKKRLVRFRLCPSSSCMSTTASVVGCNTGYGDYVIDMNEYVNAYWEYKQQEKEYKCYQYGLSTCQCNNDDDYGDDNNNQDEEQEQEKEEFNEEQCLYQCFVNAGKNDCTAYLDYEVENDNDDQAENEVEQIDIGEYMECKQFEYEKQQEEEEEDNGERRRHRRRLEDENQDQDDEEEEDKEYFIGPYCAEQGSAIYMGMFVDDTCTEAADSYHGKNTFSDLIGYSLPYGKKSIVGNYECVSCLDKFNMEDKDDNNDNENQQEEQNLADVCNELYNNAGKCEEHLPSSIGTLNTNACRYIEGIKITTDTGVIETSTTRSNPVATAWTVIFALIFTTLGFYVWYLRMRLGRKTDPLLY